MSAQRTKKKRIGSRRWVANQNETPKADELDITDSPSVTQHHTPEENNESLSVMSNHDGSQSEIQPPPSPDLTSHRRKLGSNRRSKGRQLLTESPDELREEVEENTRGNEALVTTHTSPAIQSERQEELSQGSEHDMSATHDSPLHSAIMPGYPCKVQNPTTTNRPGDVLEILIPPSGNQQAEHDENEADCKAMSYSCELVTDKSDTLQSEGVREDARLVGSSDLTGLSVLSSPTVDQHLILQSNSATAKEMERDGDTVLLRQDVNLQGNYLMNESHVESVVKGSSLPLNSEPQDCSVGTEEQTDTNFSPTVNRRKLGSSRRSKGRQHLKDPVAESCSETKEDVVENIRGDEAFEHMSLPIDTAVQVKPVETMLEGVEKSEGFSVQVQQLAHHVGISELNSSSLDPTTPVDQQVIYQSNVRELPDERPSVYSVTEKESKERDEDTHLLRQWGILQPNDLMTESHVESDNVESPMTLVVTAEENSHREHTDPECSIKQTAVSPPEEELSTNEEQSEHFSLSGEDLRAQYSEDSVEKMHEKEVKPTEMQEIHHADFSSQSEIHEVTEKSDTCSGNMADQTEVSDTYQSELIVDNIDDSATTQDVSNPDDKQDELPLKESNVEALDQINADCHVYDTEKPQTSDIEGADTAVGQVNEGEGQVEDDIKPTAEQTSHQEKEGLPSEMEESESSPQTLQSETNAALDSHPEDISVKTDDQNDTDFNPIGNRRKLGSSRRNKGRQHVKDSGAQSHKPTEENVEDTGDNEALDTSLALQTRSQEELSQECEHDIIIPVTYDSSLCTAFSPDNSEVQKPTATNDSEAELESFIPKSENVQGGHKAEVSDTSGQVAQEVMDNSHTLHNEEVSSSHYSEGTVNDIHGQEVNPTQIQETHESDYSFETVIHDAAEKSDTCSGNLKDQDEVSDTYQSELIVENTDDSATTQDVLNPDDKQDELPLKESNVEALDQINADCHVYDTEKPQTSDIERADTAVGQVNEGEGQVEDDIKPTAEQTSHQEKEGLPSEMEESESSPQTLQSETNSALDSHPENISVKTDDQNDTDFNAIGNRRKLGSSRRNKGRQHVKDSGAQSHKPTEDVTGDTRDNEALEAMPVTIVTAIQEISMETMLEVNDKFELSQTEEVSDNMKENAHVSTSDLSSISVQSSNTVEQQVINQSNVRETPDEEHTSVYFIKDRESKEGDEDTDLLRQWGILQANDLVNESHLKSEGVRFSITPEVTTEKNSHKEHAEPECNVEQATVSSPKEELLTNENEHLSPSEVTAAQHSEDAVEKMHEEEVKPTETQEIHHADFSFQSEIHEVTEKSDTCSGNMADQTEVSDTYQSELTVENIDDSATTQDVSNPDDKQDELPLKENNVEALDQINADYQVYDTEKPQTSDIERADTAVGQVNEGEGQVEDDIKPTAEQTSHQEKEGLPSEMEASESSPQTLQSETNAALDSHPENISVKTDDQNDTDFKPIGNRRKLGSSRRNKGRQHVKDSGAQSHKPTEENVEDTGDNEALDTSLALQTRSQEELSKECEHDIIIPVTYDSSLCTASSPDNSEVQKPTATNDSEAELESFIAKSENVQGGHKAEVSDTSGQVAQEVMDNSHTLHNEEVSSSHYSEGTVNDIHEQVVNPTQIQETHESDYSFETVIHDAAEKSDTCSGNLKDQDEVSDTYQSELIVDNIDDSATTQDVLNPDDKQDELPLKESNVEALDKINVDYHVYDTEKPQTSDIEGADTAVGQVNEGEGQVEDDIKPTAEQTSHQEKEGLPSEMEESESSPQTLQSETNAALDSHPENISVKTDDQNDTDFKPIGNRRKLGSSRRNKGRQHVKDSGAQSHKPTEENVEDTGDNEALDTSLALQTRSQEELSKECEHDIIIPVTYDSSLCTASSPDNSEVQKPTATNDSEAELESFIPKSENVQGGHKAEVSDTSGQVAQEVMDNSHTLHNEEVSSSHYSEGTVNDIHGQEVNPTQIQETHESDYSFETVIHDAAEKSDTCSGNLKDQDEVSDTYQSELIVENTDDSATTQDVLNPDDKQDELPLKESNVEALDKINVDYHVYDTEKPQTSDIEGADTAVGQVNEGEGQVEDDIKPTAEQTSHQEKEGLPSEMEESESSPQTLQPETNAALDSHPEDISVKTDDQNNTDFKPIGNRRKLGSSRRNKGRQHVKDSGAQSHKPTEENVEDTRDNESLKATSVTIVTAIQEISVETMLETNELSQTKEVSDNIKETAHVSTSDLSSVSVQSSNTVEQQVINQSNVRETPDEEHTSVYFMKDRESKEGDEDTDLLRQWGILQPNDLVNESHLKSDSAESPITLVVTTEESIHREHTEPECGIEQSTVSSPKEELSTNEEQSEHFSLSGEDLRAQYSEDSVKKEEEVKPTEIQEMHQVDYSLIKESQSLLTLQSEIKSPLDTQPMDNSQSIKEETHSGFKPSGNRRKLGSSRRNKGRQHVPDTVTEPYTELKEEVVENTWGDEASENPETGRQGKTKDQTNPTVKEEENAEKLPEKDTTLSQNIMDNSTTVTTDITSRSDNNEEEMKHVQEPENLTQLTGYDTVKMDLMQSLEASVGKDDSDTQNISTRSVTSDVLDFKTQNTESLPGDKDLLGQERTVAESSVDLQGQPRQVEVIEESEDPVNKDCAAQEISFTAAQNKSDTWALFDIDHEDNISAKPAVVVSEESGISTAVDEGNSQQDTQEKNPADSSENLQGKIKQKKRKMGSTRRIQLSRKQEGDTDNRDETKESTSDMEVDVRNLDRMEVDKELPLIVATEVSQKEHTQPSQISEYKKQQETNETSSVHDEGQKLQSSTTDLQTTESNMISGTVDSVGLLPEQAASHNEGAVNPVTFVHGADVRGSEGNADVSREPPQLRDFTSTEMQTPSVVAGRNKRSINQLPPPNTEGTTNSGSGITVTFCETAQSTQNDEQSPKGIKKIQDQALESTEAPSVAVADVEKATSVVRGGAGEEHKNTQESTQEPNNVNEGPHNTNSEMKNASPNFSSTNRRRKLGSTRRGLGSRSKGEDLRQKQEADNEETATNVGDVLTESVPGLEEKEPQLHKEHKDGDSEPRKEQVFETVERSHTGESQSKPLGHHTAEENPDSLSRPEETEHQLTPDHLPAQPSTSPKHDFMSESAAGGRRRKMGSHRKSRGHGAQTAGEDRTIDAQKGRDVRSVTDESASKTAGQHREESLGLDKISETDESDSRPSFDISLSKAAEPSKPVSEIRVIPVHHPNAAVRLGRENLNAFSLAGDSRGADVRSKSFNVLMIGDSSVGKTSFMKRAQSGKFSIDIPASIGLDSCKWTVVVDGKPVVLHLWDTAGQERFRSITRQVFHKAQAFLLMYDITSSQSFSAISYWANCIEEGAAENTIILLLGNKSDRSERQVKTQEAETLAKELDFEFMECSAATGENVIESLELVARMLSQMVDTREEAMVLHKDPPQKKRCC